MNHSGIGRAICVALADAGCDVTLAARRKEELVASQAEVQAAGGDTCKSLCVVTDVTQRASVLALVAAAEEAFGTTDIIVNCAGVMYFTLMKVGGVRQQFKKITSLIFAKLKTIFAWF